MKELIGQSKKSRGDVCKIQSLSFSGDHVGYAICVYSMPSSSTSKSSNFEASCIVT